MAVRKRIGFYKKTGATEGALTGAGGFWLALADFPLLFGIKIKLLFEIAALYGYPVNDYRERLYILHIFQLAFSSQQRRREESQPSSVPAVRDLVQPPPAARQPTPPRRQESAPPTGTGHQPIHSTVFPWVPGRRGRPDRTGPTGTPYRTRTMAAGWLLDFARGGQLMLPQSCRRPGPGTVQGQAGPLRTGQPQRPATRSRRLGGRHGRWLSRHSTGQIHRNCWPHPA